MEVRLRLLCLLTWCIGPTLIRGQSSSYFFRPGPGLLQPGSHNQPFPQIFQHSPQQFDTPQNLGNLYNQNVEAPRIQTQQAQLQPQQQIQYLSQGEQQQQQQVQQLYQSEFQNQFRVPQAMNPPQYFPGLQDFQVGQQIPTIPDSIAQNQLNRIQQGQQFLPVENSQKPFQQQLFLPVEHLRQQFQPSEQSQKQQFLPSYHSQQFQPAEQSQQQFQPAEQSQQQFQPAEQSQQQFQPAEQSKQQFQPAEQSQQQFQPAEQSQQQFQPAEQSQQQFQPAEQSQQQFQPAEQSQQQFQPAEQSQQQFQPAEQSQQQFQPAEQSQQQFQSAAEQLQLQQFQPPEQSLQQQFLPVAHTKEQLSQLSPPQGQPILQVEPAQHQLTQYQQSEQLISAKPDYGKIEQPQLELPSPPPETPPTQTQQILHAEQPQQQTQGKQIIYGEQPQPNPPQPFSQFAYPLPKPHKQSPFNMQGSSFTTLQKQSFPNHNFVPGQYSSGPYTIIAAKPEELISSLTNPNDIETVISPKVLSGPPHEIQTTDLNSAVNTETVAISQLSDSDKEKEESDERSFEVTIKNPSTTAEPTTPSTQEKTRRSNGSEGRQRQTYRLQNPRIEPEPENIIRTFPPYQPTPANIEEEPITTYKSKYVLPSRLVTVAPQTQMAFSDKPLDLSSPTPQEPTIVHRSRSKIVSNSTLRKRRPRPPLDSAVVAPSLVEPMSSILPESVNSRPISKIVLAAPSENNSAVTATPNVNISRALTLQRILMFRAKMNNSLNSQNGKISTTRVPIKISRPPFTKSRRVEVINDESLKEETQQ